MATERYCILYLDIILGVDALVIPYLHREEGFGGARVFFGHELLCARGEDKDED